MHPVQFLIKNRIPQSLFFTVLISFLSVPLMDSPEVVFAQINPTYTAPSLEQIQVIIDDFLVNDDTTGGLADQLSPDIAKDNAGNFIIVWTDTRFGNPDIFAQRFSSTGVPIGSNFKVNDDFGIADQDEPAVAADSSGDFVVTWKDYRNIDCAIFAQRYNSTGIAIGNNFKVNDGGGCFPLWSSPAVATDDSGDFVITWIDSRSGSWAVYAQRYSSNGIPSSLNIKVNNDSIGTPFSPDIVMDKYGNFVIAWKTELNDKGDIYAKRYNASGNPAGSEFRVNDAAGFVLRRYASIDMNRFGSFIISWQDSRNGYGDIYAQRYDSLAAALGANIKANDDVGTAFQDTPDVTMGDSGNFVLTWIDQRNGVFRADIYAQRYNQLGTRIGVNFKVNADSEYFTVLTPAIAMDDSSNFVITWSHYPNWDHGPRDVYAQRYNFTATPLGSNFIVNDDTGSAPQYSPAIAVDSTGNFVITWQDYCYGLYDPFYGRQSNADIYAQRYDLTGKILGSNFRVNDDTGTADQMSPAIAMNASGNFIIAWANWRNSYYSYYGTRVNADIYFQRYDSSGAPLGPNAKANDDTGKADQMSPKIAVDSHGCFVLTWQDWRNGWYDEYGILHNPDVYAQRFDSAGSPLGSNFRVNDDPRMVYDQIAPDISMDGPGNFVIAWQDDRNLTFQIYAQRYDSVGTPLGSNFKVNDKGGSGYQMPTTVAENFLGNLIIVWQDYRNNNYYPDIYAQRYDLIGAPVGTNFKVNDDIGYSWQEYPAIALDNSDNFVVAWQDRRNGWYDDDVYAQKYDSFGNAVGGNFLVPNIEYASFAQEYPKVAIKGSNIYLTWMDNRRAKGWDIYAKVVDWNWTDVKEENIAGLPKSFELHQNYPNPFNPTTTIPFQAGSRDLGVDRRIHTTLKIYNILGQKVRTLVDEEKAAGNYNIIWDGKDDSGKEVASGIYFYQLKTKDYTATKKMVLLR